MARADKAAAVADIAEQFRASTATLITEYRGLTVANLAELRRSLGVSATYAVAKNTLIKRAASEAGVEGLDALFAGPTAIAFIAGEPVDAAKAIKTIRENLHRTEMSDWARVLHMDAFSFLAQSDERFDIIYVAPPQYRQMWSKALLALDERLLLKQDGVVVVQIFPKEFEPLPLKHLALTDQRKYGSTMLCFYEQPGVIDALEGRDDMDPARDRDPADEV